MRPILVLSLLVSPATAGIVIDEFDDPASVAMENVFVTSEDVGPLSATRMIRIASIAADPDARMEISSSTLKTEFGDLHPTSPLGPNVFASLIYTFEPADFTSGNAFLFDLLSVSGSVPPDFLRVIIYDDQQGRSYFATAPVPLGASLVALPFDEFVLRGGPAVPIHFDKIDEFWVEIHANRDLDDYTSHAWIVEIDRIRVGTVPEPDGILLLAIFYRHRRRLAGHRL